MSKLATYTKPRAASSGAYAALRTDVIPNDLSAGQASPVCELHNVVADRIWTCYQTRLVVLFRADLEPVFDEHQPDLFDPNDSIPYLS